MTIASVVRPTNIGLPNATKAGNEPKKTPKTPQDEAISFFTHVGQDSEPVQVWELALEDDGGPGPGKNYIRLPPPIKPYILRFSIQPGTEVSRNGVLKSDFPMDGGVFQRGDWKERKLPSDLSKPIQIDLPISAPGAFCYFIEYDSPSSNHRVQGRPGYFNVDPIIHLPARTPFFPQDVTVVTNPLNDESSGAILPKDAALSLDGLTILSTLAKWLGTTDKWEPFFAESSRRGYNMLHWAPLQQRGESGSPYSIKDQLAFDKNILKNSDATDGGLQEIEDVMDFARKKYGLGGVTDIVVNHMAYDSPWLQEHPEAGYSPYNTPHLAPAVELEDVLFDLTDNLSALGLPTVLRSEEDLQRLIPHIKDAIDGANLWEYYVFDVEKSVKAVAESLMSGKSKAWSGEELSNLNLDQLVNVVKTSNIIDNYRAFSSRYCTSVGPAVAAGFIQAAYPDDSVENQSSKWGKILDILNVDLYKEINEDVKIAVDSTVGRLRYTRLDENGPNIGEINRKTPICEPYFTRLPRNETTSKHPDSALSLANNGWMWAADPLNNFAEYPSKAYIRREIIVWGDCVKLRYGSKPEDNSWLWRHMTSYAELLAGIFDGFRLDNCHSTPLPVGKAIIDAGRRVNPNLYIMAELFTGSEEMDLKFVRELGINSLVREAYNGDTIKNSGDLLWRYGLGRPVGSMDVACLTSAGEINASLPSANAASRPAKITPLQGSVPHAVMYDLTHDNQSPFYKRTAEDALSTGALVTFCAAAVGSNKGFDDLYPKYLDLVTDNRMYSLTSKEKEREGGIGPIKRVLNALHVEMMKNGFSEGHVHQEGQYLMVHRVHPITHKGYMLVAHTAYKGFEGRGWVHPIKLGRTSISYLFGASIHTDFSRWKDDPSTHNGIPSVLKDIPKPEIRKGEENGETYEEVIVPDEFPPGSIMVFSTQMSDISGDLDDFCKQDVEKSMSELDLVDLNVVLYRADGEERDATGGDGVYTIPNYGSLTYCGLEGWMHPLRIITKKNDLGHPLCQHLREGTWAFDYVTQRLERQTGDLPRLSAPAKWLSSRFDRIKATVPSFMRPKYFSLVIHEAYKAARKAAIEQCSEFVSSGHSLTHDLALCSVQMYGLVKSASLDPAKAVPSLAAGLPHFTAGWARCWGRDVFISLRGLFLTTGNFQAAHAHILSFGSTLKHGLIPNLLDSTRNPRYNCRDGPWWYIQNIQDYTVTAPNGLSILAEKVKRRFPADDTWVPWDSPKAYEWESSVAELIQEILQKHAQGIEFREYNAGPNLDMDMRDEGFNQKIWVDWTTGIIFGGNRYNCGTWMDKNGSSEKAGNKGLPATPRDGAPVEITGLLKSTVTWLDKLSKGGSFPFKGVKATIGGEERIVTYKEWSDLLQASFEKCYYVPSNPAEDDQYMINKNLVNRRGIYKDVYGTPKDREWSDYQFRCNFTLPMVVAPELFTPSKAIDALRIADAVLRAPLGMKTLDPSDSQYRPDYDNSNDSSDQSIAKGWNYHQGPEWGFPLGWFLLAYLQFDRIAGEGTSDQNKTLHYISSILRKLAHHIDKDPWRGLPELTNSNGSYCYDSCNTQAWSASTILDVLEEMHKLGLE
ncbi:glycogen debranching enzyme [Cryptococcus depauperatus CBS 7841]|uniref:Glycogen debranching enzyme n=1 Tax=Cryptococcus depauperatus CBS 7841 TaxID=1295531 RepID=A0A1E3IJA2_9TREE|nr:glycogen debranching enzyme [Cryptococcus depauperatus CBS 7841]